MLTLTVVKLSPGTITVAKFNKLTKKTSTAKEYEYTDQNLDEVVQTLGKQIRSKKLRLLVSTKLSYTTKLKVPTKLDEVELRKYIFDEISSKIPENLTDSDWDFKLEKDPKTKEDYAVVFAPVKDEVMPILKLLSDKGFVIDSVGIENPTKEPFKLARLLPKKPSIKLNKKIVVTLLLVSVTTLAAMSAFLFIKNKPSETQNTEIPTPAPNEVPQKPEAEGDEVGDEQIYSISIKVLNGSGIAGEAGIVSDLLKENGFENVSTANAGSYDYEKTQIMAKGEVLSESLDEIKNSLRGYVIEELEPEDSQETDVIVIVGSDKP